MAKLDLTDLARQLSQPDSIFDSASELSSTRMTAGQ